MIQLYTHTHMYSFSYSFPLWLITRYWIFPVLDRWSLCLFMYSIVYLLIPNSYFVLPPPLATIRLFSISVSTRMIFITSLNELITSLSKWLSDFFLKFAFPRVWFYYNILFLSLVQGYFIVIDLCMFFDVILS